MPPKSSTKHARTAAQLPKAHERPTKRAKTQESHVSAKPKARLVSPPPSSSKGKEKQISKPKPSSKTIPKAKDKAKAPVPALELEHAPELLPTTFKFVAGSYEKLLYGLEGSTSTSASGELEFSLKPIFIFPAHVSSVKAVAASPSGGKWLATGSADEIIKVWDLRRRREIGGLMHHEGSITQLTFATRSHLLSVSEDGTLALFRTRDWAVLRTFKGHKGRVNSVAVHPSGKLALSVGVDRTLRMWDLMRGKGGASMRLGVEGELVRWSTDGTILCVQHQKQIDLYSTDLTLLLIVTHPSRIQDVLFVPRVDGAGEVMLVAAEDKKITAYDVTPLIDAEKNRKKDDEHPELPTPEVVAQFVGHGNRVKAMSVLRIALPLADRPSTTILGSVSSDGTAHIYDLYALPAASPSEQKQEVLQIEPDAKYDSQGTRLTCVTLADGDVGTEASAGKRKRGGEDEEDDEEEWSEDVEDDDGDDDEEVEGEEESEDEDDGEEEGEEV
ncbi:WD40 repeat-like protein [Dentipellis sp. KUC8613]|nr:WD40 repeat-like protein [Dentipellis sp. KUC8613]